jgi:hypothetical protein
MSRLTSFARGLQQLSEFVASFRIGSEPAPRRFTAAILHTVWTEPSDERALACVQQLVTENRAAATKVRAQLGDSAKSYGGDRACRLLDAALTGSSITPPHPRDAARFEAEAALARTPIGDAFALLAEREPRLQQIRDQLAQAFASVRPESEDARSPSVNRMLFEAKREVAEIVGPTSSQGDALLRTYVARNIAYQTLELATGNPRGIDPEKPYFDRGTREGAA